MEVVIIEKNKISLVTNDELRILKLIGYGKNSLWFRYAPFSSLRYPEDISYYDLIKLFIEFFNIIRYVEVNPKYHWVDWVHKEDFAEKSVIEIITKFYNIHSDFFKEITAFYGYNEKLPASKILNDFLFKKFDILLDGEDIKIGYFT